MNCGKFWKYLWYLILHGYKDAMLADAIESMLPGTYQAQFNLRDHVLQDSLTIVCLSLAGNVYEITYKVEEVVEEQENIQKVLRIRWEKWVGFYDGRVRQLVETNMDKIVSFIPEQGKALYDGRDLTKAQQ